MNCKNHSGVNGVNTCSKCGEWLCEDCSIELNGRIYCKSCISKEMSEEKTSKKDYEFFKEKSCGSKTISPFFTFCFAFIPGCGQMYVGLAKRGLLLMALFFGMAYMTSFSELFMAATFIVYCYSFFDTFNCKNKILSGEYVKDDVDDIKSFFYSNKKILGLSLIIILLLEMFRDFRYSYFGQITCNILVVVFIMLGIYVIFIRNKKDQ